MPTTSVGEATPEFDERTVVDAAKSGDQGALGELYDYYFPRIYRFVAARLGAGEDAEDVTEEVFLKVIDGLGKFSWRDVPFGAWIFRIARNEVVSHARKQKTRGASSQLSDTIADASQDFVRAVEMEFTLEIVREAAARLPEAQRQVIALRFGAGLSVAETARTLNKSENNVKVLQHKAIARLQQWVGNQ
ncbi:MAG: sigma-70 family RNA polymerase sigma factor [Dehalococcoidia bacterium]